MASCLLVVLCFVNTIIGRVGQKSLLENFAAYEQTEDTLFKVANLDQDVQELKARTEKYLQTGTSSQLVHAMDLQKTLTEQIASDNFSIADPRIQSRLNEMRKELSAFRKLLPRAADERELRTRLIQTDLPEKHQSILLLLEEVRQMLDLDQDGEMNSEYLQLAQTHEQSLQYFQQYFIEPNAAAFERALSSIDQSKSLAAQIVQSIDDEPAKVLGKKLDEEFSQLKKLGSRAVQATRSYMFYSNVVMAGEISEFVYDSNQLKQYVEDKRVLGRELRNQSANRTRLLGLLASIFAVGLAILMATRLSYMIVSPISRLTETFRQLGQGKHVDQIPEMDRTDEIGRMARAAKIFRDKNKETSELLQRSEQLTLELEKKAEALEETNQELDNFAYVASHDLKSPLRGITNLANWVQEDCESLLPDDSKNHLKLMKERVAKLERLLDDLLDYSRAGRINPTPENVDIEELVSSVVSIIDLPDGFTIKLITPTFNICTVRTPLAQALMNLVTNGVKYNDKGPNGKVEISAEEINDFVHFSIRDNGPGIEPQYHAKIFEMYQRLKTVDTEGSGMGLAIVKKLIARYGGELTIESEYGSGAIFSFTWPNTDEAMCELSGNLADKPGQQIALRPGTNEHSLS